MKIELWCIGKTSFDYLKQGIITYSSRLKHYVDFNIVEIEDVKNLSTLSVKELKAKEARLILDKLPNDNFLVLLDEQGKQMDSAEFSGFIQQQLNYSSKKMVFLVGGAYGFDNSLYQRADFQLSLSKMTFSHQMVRLFFAEQLYRAFTIIRNEKYHNP